MLPSRKEKKGTKNNNTNLAQTQTNKKHKLKVHINKLVKNNNSNKIIQLLTVAPKLVTYTCAADALNSVLQQLRTG